MQGLLSSAAFRGDTAVPGPRRVAAPREPTSASQSHRLFQNEHFKFRTKHQICFRSIPIKRKKVALEGIYLLPRDMSLPTGKIWHLLRSSSLCLRHKAAECASCCGAIERLPTPTCYVVFFLFTPLTSALLERGGPCASPSGRRPRLCSDIQFLITRCGHIFDA